VCVHVAHFMAISPLSEESFPSAIDMPLVNTHKFLLFDMIVTRKHAYLHLYMRICVCECAGPTHTNFLYFNLEPLSLSLFL